MACRQIETKMRCFKLLDERDMARDFYRQMAELQMRAAILNGSAAHGTRNLDAQGESVQWKGKLDLTLICATGPAR
jgi:hypothetical protein